MKPLPFWAIFGLVLLCLVELTTCDLQKGVLPTSGGAYDVDSSGDVQPKVHMSKDSKPLPLNPRMRQGHTTIMNPGKTFVSAKSIAENLASGNSESPVDGSRALTQQDNQVTEGTFNGGDLNGILNKAIGEQPNPLLENHVYSTANPADPKNSPLRQAVQTLQPFEYPKKIDLTPNVVYRQPSSPSRRPSAKRFRNLRERRLQPVGQVTFPYQGVQPVSMMPSPPSVLVFNKRSQAVPELNNKILQIAESRNSFHLNPYEDTVITGEGAAALRRYNTMRKTESEIMRLIADIKRSADDLQIAMTHNTATLEDRLQRTTQLIDGFNIV